MSKTALLFGSIGTVVESSDIQRTAYNQALQESGSPWNWDRETYTELLSQSGGKERLAMLGSATGVDFSVAEIAAIHSRKTELAGEALLAARPSPRPGVAELIAYCKSHQIKIGFVTPVPRQHLWPRFAVVI